MRIAILALVAILAGASVGLSITWIEFRGVDEHFTYMSRTKAAISPDQAPPTVQVDGGSSFDFGVLNHDQTREKTFVIQNVGGRPLTLAWASVTCGRCIQNGHDFTETTVQPGDKCEVTVTYATKKPNPRFSEAAYLRTNDPRVPSLRLEITGDVIKAVRLDPETLTLNSVLASEGTTSSVDLHGFHSDKLELLKFDFQNPSTSSLFEITPRKLEPDEYKSTEHARAGIRLQIAVKPGLPIGPISQTVTFKVKTEEEHSVELPINGTVVGDLSVIGKYVDTSTAAFSLGFVKKEEGKTGELFVLVKGPHRNDVKLTVGEVDPPELKVEVGEAVPFADGKVMKHLIRVTIPKGTAPMSRLGNQQGKAGRLVLNSTHPFSKDLTIEVKFAVD